MARLPFPCSLDVGALPFPVVTAPSAGHLLGSCCLRPALVVHTVQEPIMVPGGNVLFIDPLALGAFCCHLSVWVPSFSMVVSSLTASSFQSLNCCNHIEYMDTFGGELTFLQYIHLCSLLIGLLYLFY